MKINLLVSFLFFILYWLLVAIGNADFNPDDTMWFITGEEPREWLFLYYLCPIISFIGAAFISGVIRAIFDLESFPWRRIIIFIVVFWVLDHSAVFTNFYYWNLSFNWDSSLSFVGILAFLLETLFSFHEFTAPAIAIILTAFIIRKIKLWSLYMKLKIETANNYFKN